jgi:prepilin peptidase CpaA
MAWSLMPWILAGAVLACLLAAASTDVLSRTIPNRIVLVVMVSGIGLRLLAVPTSLWVSLLAAIAVLVVLGILAAYDLIGWGDAKLIAAVTLAVPPGSVVPLLLAIVLAGGLLSCVYIAARTVLRRTRWLAGPAEPQSYDAGVLGRLVHREGARILADEPMPYALAIVGGVAYAMATG